MMMTNPSARLVLALWLTSIAPVVHTMSNSVGVVVSSLLSPLGRRFSTPYALPTLIDGRVTLIECSTSTCH